MTHAPDRPIRIGLVGFGVGGNYFHAPFIEAARGIELAAVVTTSPQRRQELGARFPGVPAYDSLAAMAAAEELDAVTITTPPQTRRDLVLEALELGLHVVADKPFAPDAAAGELLAQAAADAGRILAVYHNRRWDSDVVTLRSLITNGRLGRVSRFCSTMDQDDPGTLEAGPGGGLLRDLGSHVVDQALWLFGSARTVFATLDWADTPDGPTDIGFAIMITHRSGVTSLLTATKKNHVEGRTLLAYGDQASYRVASTDVQAEASLQGARPADDPAGWGFEPESAWGTLLTADGTAAVPAQQGSYVTYYEQLAQAVRTGGAPPVSAGEAIDVLRVLDAARTSAATGTSVSPPAMG